MEEERLRELVSEMIRNYANCFLEERRMFEKAVEMEINFESIIRYDTEIARLKGEQEKYTALCLGLHEDLRQGVITEEEFERLHGEFKRKAAEFEAAQKRQEDMIKELFKNSVTSAARLKMMQESGEIKEIDRYTLCSMVKKIEVFEDRRLEIEFYYKNQYRMMCEVNKRIKQDRNKERSA